MSTQPQYGVPRVLYGEASREVEPQPGWHAVRRAGDRVERRVTRLVRDAVHAGRKAVDYQVFTSTLMNRATDPKAIEFAAERTTALIRGPLERGIMRALTDVVNVAGRTELKVARTRKGFRYAKKDPRKIDIPGGDVLGALRFDVTNPAAVRWIREHAALQVEGISEATRQSIVDLLVRSFERGIPTGRIATQLRGLIGLTPQQAQAVANLADAIASNPGGRVYAGERAIRVPEDPSDAWVDKQLNRYSDKLLNDRAKMIARTETIAASNEGQRQAWIQAEAAGLLRSDEVQRVWIITPDDRLCPICEELAGEVADIDGVFVSPEVGELTGPPAHPQCRCAQGLVRRRDERVARAAGEGEGHEFHGNQWTGYHGTSASNLKKILKDGLKRSESGRVWKSLSKSGVVYATSSFKDAQEFAQSAAAAKGDLIAILKVEIPKSEAAKLRADRNKVVKDGPFKDVAGVKRFEFKGDIPASWIKSVTVKDYFAQKKIVATPQKFDKLVDTLRRSAAEAVEVVYVPVALLEDEPRAAGEAEGHEFHGNQWTGGSAQERLDSLSQTGDDLSLPFPSSGDTLARASGLAPERRKVPVASLVGNSLQTDVSRAGVEREIKLKNDRPIKVVQDGDKFQINDGYHRAVAAWARGDKEIDAEVYKPSPTEGRAALAGPHKWCTTQIDVPEPLRTNILVAGRAIPDEWLAVHGRETTPHVTVLYGLHDGFGLAEITSGFGPVRLTLGQVDAFEDVEEGTADALMIRVESPDLERLRALLLQLPHKEQLKEYIPHLTIAYVQPGMGKDLVQKFQGWMMGETFATRQLTFSGRLGEKRRLPLGGQLIKETVQ